MTQEQPLPQQRSRSLGPILFAALLATLAFTLARGARWPNDWAEAQWLIGYDFGFVKRGLPGAVLDGIRALAPGGIHVESLIKALGAGALFACNAVVLWLCWSSATRAGYSRDSVFAGLLLTSSTYVVMSGHLTGYYDQIHVVLTFLCMGLLLRDQVWPAALLAGVGVLVHENLVGVGLPSILFLTWLKHTNRDGQGLGLPSYLRKYLPVFVVPCAVFVSLLVYQALYLDPVELGRKLSLDIQRYRFVQSDMHLNVPGAMTHSFMTYLGEQSLYFTARLRNPVYLSQVLPALGLMLVFSWRALAGRRFRICSFALLALVTLLPLLMHAIAWDMTRIWNYPLLVVLMGYWAIQQTSPERERVSVTPIWLAALASVALVHHLFLEITLMDRAEDRFGYGMRALGYLPALALLVWLWWPSRGVRSEPTA